MRHLLLALALLLPGSAGAACHTFTFDDLPRAFASIGELRDGTFVAKFGGNWRTTFDRDDDPAAVPDSLGQAAVWFSIANEHGNVAARYSCFIDENGSDDLVIDFGRDTVLSASFVYSSGFTYCRCLEPSCEHLLCMAGAIAPGSNARVELTHRGDNADEFPFTGGRSYFTESGYYADIGDGSFCGDPNGVYCAWHSITVKALKPCRYLHVKVACLGGGFFLDDLRVCTTAQADDIVPVQRRSWGEVKVRYR